MELLQIRYYQRLKETLDYSVSPCHHTVKISAPFLPFLLYISMILFPGQLAAKRATWKRIDSCKARPPKTSKEAPDSVKLDFKQQVCLVTEL